MKILLLEDNSTDAELTIRALKKAWPQCKIEHVSLVKEAQKILSVKPEGFDIALLDMQLPDGNGLDILMEIRQKQIDMAVAMLTGSGDEEVAVAALKAGADDYMVKQPGYVSKISQLVEFAIENYKSIRQRDSNFIRILYIEHNAADVDLTSRHFTRYAPYLQIKNVPTGEEALKLLPDKGTKPEKWEYQVILMDYRLPGMNALELIKEIRQDRKLDLPILIVTGHGNEEVAVQALKLGASEYLVKRKNYLTRLPSLITGAYQNCELKRKQKALAESETKYRLLAENSGDVIFTLDFDLNFTYVSPAVFKLRGFTVDEVLQQNITETLTPDSLKKVNLLIDKMVPEALAGNQLPESVITELQTCKKDNTIIWIEITATVLTNDLGKPIGILGATRDISKRKAAQEELRKLSRAVIQSTVSISITDVEGNIEYVNPQFTNLSGYAFDEVVGRNTRILKSGKHPGSFYKELWDTILSGKEWHGEIQNKKKNGELYWASAGISSLVNDEGEITHFVAVKEDITERKNLINDLIVAKEKAEAADRLKTAFINNISHEIRTPLNGILGFGSFLSQNNISDNERETYRQLLEKSSERLLNTITDYVDISLITTGNMTVYKSVFALSEVTDELYETYKKRMSEKGLDFQINVTDENRSVQLDSDPGLLKKVIGHLIDNAIKFTSKGYVKIGYILKNGVVEFSIEDSGRGIAPEMKDQVFNIFTQAESHLTRGYEGSGLGLSICKGIIKLLGGEIKLETSKSGGLIVIFTLPAAKQLTDNKIVLPETNSKNNGLCVLIVEDDKVNSYFVELVLKTVGIDFVTVENGRDAVEQCRSNNDIGLVLMDLKMPVMDGLEATRQIKKFKPKLPVIAVTGYALKGDREIAIKAGCDDYLTKPVKKDTLIDKIRLFLPV